MINLTACNKSPNVIGENTAHGAELYKSRKQYTLIYQNRERHLYSIRHWSRNKITSDAQAREVASALLAKWVKQAESEVRDAAE